MSLGEALVKNIEKEVAAGKKAPLTAIGEDGHTVARVVLKDRDRLGSLAAEVSVIKKVSGAPSAARVDVRERAERLAGRVSYLPERLKFVETDAAGSAILRSSPETMRAPRSEYFEARVGQSEVTLRRFAPRPSGGGRDAVPFHTTDDTLGRLADDAAAVLNNSKK